MNDKKKAIIFNEDPTIQSKIKYRKRKKSLKLYKNNFNINNNLQNNFSLRNNIMYNYNINTLSSNSKKNNKINTILLKNKNNASIQSNFNFKKNKTKSMSLSNTNKNNENSFINNIQNNLISNQFFKKSEIYNKKPFSSYNSKVNLFENINNKSNSLPPLYRKNLYKKINSFNNMNKNNLNINKVNIIFNIENDNKNKSFITNIENYINYLLKTNKNNKKKENDINNFFNYFKNINKKFNIPFLIKKTISQKDFSSQISDPKNNLNKLISYPIITYKFFEQIIDTITRKIKFLNSKNKELFESDVINIIKDEYDILLKIGKKNLNKSFVSYGYEVDPLEHFYIKKFLNDYVNESNKNKNIKNENNFLITTSLNDDDFDKKIIKNNSSINNNINENKNNKNLNLMMKLMLNEKRLKKQCLSENERNKIKFKNFSPKTINTKNNDNNSNENLQSLKTCMNSDNFRHKNKRIFKNTILNENFDNNKIFNKKTLTTSSLNINESIEILKHRYTNHKKENITLNSLNNETIKLNNSFNEKIKNSNNENKTFKNNNKEINKNLILNILSQNKSKINEKDKIDKNNNINNKNNNINNNKNNNINNKNNDINNNNLNDKKINENIKIDNIKNKKINNEKNDINYKNNDNKENKHNNNDIINVIKNLDNKIVEKFSKTNDENIKKNKLINSKEKIENKLNEKNNNLINDNLKDNDSIQQKILLEKEEKKKENELKNLENFQKNNLIKLINQTEIIKKKKIKFYNNNKNNTIENSPNNSFSDLNLKLNKKKLFYKKKSKNNSLKNLKNINEDKNNEENNLKEINELFLKKFNFKKNNFKKRISNRKNLDYFNGKFFKYIKNTYDLEKKKNLLLLRLNEEINLKIKSGEYTEKELDLFNNFKKKIESLKNEDIQIYLLNLEEYFSNFNDQLDLIDKRNDEEKRINGFIKNLNSDLDFNKKRQKIINDKFKVVDKKILTNISDIFQVDNNDIIDIINN